MFLEVATQLETQVGGIAGLGGVNFKCCDTTHNTMIPGVGMVVANCLETLDVAFFKSFDLFDGVFLLEYVE